MNEDTFNLETRKFLKHFGVTAQREIERAVAAAMESGTLRGDETLRVRAVLTIDGLVVAHEIDGTIALA